MFDPSLKTAAKSPGWQSCLLTVVVFFFLLMTSPSRGQSTQKADSLQRVYQILPEDSSKVETLNLLFNAYLYNDIERAKRYAVEQLALSKRINYRKGMAQGNNNLGVYFNNTIDLDSTRWYYHKALAIYKELGLAEHVAKVNYGLAIVEYYSGSFDIALSILDTVVQLYRTEVKDSVGLAVAYTLVGSVSLRKGNLQIALSAVLKAVGILEKQTDEIRLADAYGQLGGVEATLGNYYKSIEYNKKALRIYDKNNDKVFAAQALNDIGLCYFYLKDYRPALEYLKNSMVLSRAMDQADLQATSLTNIGKTFGALQQFDSAATYLRQGLSLAEKAKRTVKIIESLNELGNLYLTMERPRVAIGFFSRAIPIADSINLKEGLLTAYLKRSAAHALLDQYVDALQDHRNYAAVSDSMFSEKKSQQIEELRTIFDTEKKEQEIALQKNQIGLLEQTAKVNRLQNMLLVFGLAFVVLVFAAGINAMSQKMKRNRLEKEKVDSELAFKKKELTTHALHLAKKNETLENLKQEALPMKFA